VAGRELSLSSQGYRLDVLVRLAVAEGVRVLLLTGVGDLVNAPTTTRAICERSGVCLLTAPDEEDVADILIAADSVVAGSASAAVESIEIARRSLEAALASAPLGDTAPFLEAASTAVGRRVSLSSQGAGSFAAPVLRGEEIIGTVSTDPEAGHAGTAAQCVLTMTALAIECHLGRSSLGNMGATRTRDAVLSQLLVASEAHTTDLAEHAVELGIPVYGWHGALVLRLGNLEEQASLDFLLTVGSVAIEVLRSRRRGWQLARSRGDIVLVEMLSRDPGSAWSLRAVAAAEELVAKLGEQFPNLSLRCGVGTIHPGLTGLRASVAEARAALSSRPSRRVTGHDAPGLQPLLLEWYASETAQHATKEFLGPFEELGEKRARVAISTLQAYLDEQGSLQRAAERLNVHRNAVAYRMKKIAEILPADLTDGDQRLALQLACRAWLLR
jgi:sugar diacid utilization regulator